MINIINEELCNDLIKKVKRPAISTDRRHVATPVEGMPEYYMYAVYVIHDGNNYHSHNRVNDYYECVPSLAIDLPYEYYQTIDTGVIDTVSGYYKDIIEHGITKPVFMEISHGMIVSVNEYGRYAVSIAKLLKIKTIPVVLCMFDMDKDGGDLFDEDIMNYANDLCNPYFIFSESSDSQLDSEYRTVRKPDSDDIDAMLKNHAQEQLKSDVDACLKTLTDYTI